MQTITKEETKVIKTEVYVSADGKEFSTPTDCLNWEKSYKGTLELSWQKLNKKQVSTTNYCIPWSSEDQEAYIIIPKTLEEITLINAYIACATNCDSYSTADATMIDKLLLINFGYDRDYCDIYDLHDFINKTITHIEEEENSLRAVTKSE